MRLTAPSFQGLQHTCLTPRAGPPPHPRASFPWRGHGAIRLQSLKKPDSHPPPPRGHPEPGAQAPAAYSPLSLFLEASPLLAPHTLPLADKTTVQVRSPLLCLNSGTWAGDHLEPLCPRLSKGTSNWAQLPSSLG